MKKYNLEIIIFVVNAVYMILELIASRVLSPYFGNSNIVWTCVIGIILLSSSLGNYLGGIIADKKDINKYIKLVFICIGLMIMIIPFTQQIILNAISMSINDTKIGAIMSTIILFFLPSMNIGILSPLIAKIKLKNLEKVGKISGNISALGTLGSIFGTFLGGFYLLPTFGCNEILFVLSIIIFLLIFLLNDKSKKEVILTLILITICFLSFILFVKININNGKKVLNGTLNVEVSYDTEYGRVLIYNKENNNEKYRVFSIDGASESATYINENKRNDLVYEYTKYYDLMFNANIDIKNVLMIGGAGYTYPKYFISNYLEKNIDVVEIDSIVTKLAKEYFYLDELNSNRLNIFTEDGRVFLNKNKKKYDAILNDAFLGEVPAKTLTTIEAARKIYNSLNENGVYLSNVIASLDGEKSKFLKSEVNTLKQIFKNVYVIPCNSINNIFLVQNNIIIATNDNLLFENSVEIDINNSIVFTDNYCPIE